MGKKPNTQTHSPCAGAYYRDVPYLLFNIFINDLMDGLEEVSSVTVTTGSRQAWHLPTPRMAGALFADDAVGISQHIEAAALFCDPVTAWCSTNEMQVGLSKCGIIEFLPNPEADPPILPS